MWFILKCSTSKADKKLIEKNLKVLDALQKSYFIDKVWAAWGDLIDSRDYLGNTLYDIQDIIKEAEWYHLGTTTRWGNPRHPLYLKRDSLLPFGARVVRVHY
ncbi:DUF1643 domain-containing protein [Butyrivibrio sp. VCD2006]|uniref:DUF1643 domain-containing protein n=1 Tax=Butyrivibrio sp. VCD2006 TaxID=1280664 RepID=UPI0009DC46C0